MERSAFDLFDAHKLGTYETALKELDSRGVPGPRAHELAVSLVAFEVYEDLFQLTGAIADRSK